MFRAGSSSSSYTNCREQTERLRLVTQGTTGVLFALQIQVFKGWLVFPTRRSHWHLRTQITYEVLQLINVPMEKWLPVCGWVIFKLEESPRKLEEQIAVELMIR